MSLRAFVILAVVALTAFASSLYIAAATPLEPAHDNSDPISGQWDATFKIAGASTAFKLDIRLDGGKVTGKAESAHTGAGTLSGGAWAHDKLSFSLDFPAHESIAVTGFLKDGKLVGGFEAGREMRGTREVTKK